MRIGTTAKWLSLIANDSTRFGVVFLLLLNQQVTPVVIHIQAF